MRHRSFHDPRAPSQTSLPYSPYRRNIHPKDERKVAYILVSLDELPPTTFCTRKLASSPLSSSSCLVRSALDLDESSCALTARTDQSSVVSFGLKEQRRGRDALLVAIVEVDGRRA